MKFYVTKDVFEKIPDGKFGLVSVTGADNTGISSGKRGEVYRILHRKESEK